MADVLNHRPIFNLFINIFFLIISALVLYLPLRIIRTWSKENLVLFIAIPSGPDHATQRQSLRETWLGLLPDDSYSYKFILGQKMCNIHPFDRLSEYSCESRVVSLPKGVTESTLLHVSSLRKNDIKIEIGIGFTFFVHHPVIVQSLGIRKFSLMPGNKTIVRVVLYSMPPSYLVSSEELANSSSKISSVTFHSESASGDVNNGRYSGYVYKKLSDPVYLPKGFEGVVIVDIADMILNQEENCIQKTNWEHRNLLTVLNIITANSIEENNKPYCILPSFHFTIREVTELEKFLNRTDERRVEWNKYINGMKLQLQSEADKHQDILFLNMIDVYRNLPKKMLLFYKWLFETVNVKYVMKTDDDSFVDILKIREELEKPADWDWWSCFRIGWPVKRGGKWRETSEYKEKNYPPFPSGAGYILAERPLEWMRNRLDTLSTLYQGEDVAMGIWLEGMAPTRHAGVACHFACTDRCDPHGCNVMQLTVPALYRVWLKYRDCGHRLCDCVAVSD